MWWWTVAACASAPPPVIPPGTGPDWRATEAGRYRVRSSLDGFGVLTNRVVDPRGHAVVDAWVHVVVPGRTVIDDPGECDAVGELRCTHPSGAYEARIVDPVRAGDGFGAGFRVVIDGPDGTDAVAVPDVR